MQNYSVWIQTDGSAPELVTTFDTADEAIDYVAEHTVDDITYGDCSDVPALRIGNMSADLDCPIMFCNAPFSEVA